MAYDIFETSDGAGYNQFNDLNFDAWTASGDDEHIFVTGTRPTIYSFDELRAILDQLPAEDGLTDIQSGSGPRGRAVDAMIDFVVSFLANVAADGLTEEQQNEADQREENSTFDQRDVASESWFSDDQRIWWMNPDPINGQNFWIDLDRDQTPDTHVFVLPNGMFYDRNSDGRPDTTLVPLLPGG